MNGPEHRSTETTAAPDDRPDANQDDGARGWSFGHLDSAEWFPWGNDGQAEARIIATADGYHLAEVRARAGYQGNAHDHTNAELAYVLDGSVRTNGHHLGPGDGAAAAAGTRHDEFVALTDAHYLTIFRL